MERGNLGTLRLQGCGLEGCELKLPLVGLTRRIILSTVRIKPEIMKLSVAQRLRDLFYMLVILLVQVEAVISHKQHQSESGHAPGSRSESLCASRLPPDIVRMLRKCLPGSFLPTRSRVSRNRRHGGNGSRRRPRRRSSSNSNSSTAVLGLVLRVRIRVLVRVVVVVVVG